jgi:hypothetical protein
MTNKERMRRMAVAREQVYLEIVYDIDMCGDTVYIKGEVGGDLVQYRVAFNADGTVKYVAEK